MLDLVNETLNQMALSIEMGIIVSVIDPVLAPWDDGNSAHRVDEFDEMIGVISFVGDDEVALVTGKEFGRLRDVISFSTGEHDGQRVAQGIDADVDFGAESAFAAT